MFARIECFHLLKVRFRNCNSSHFSFTSSILCYDATEVIEAGFLFNLLLADTLMTVWKILFLGYN